MSKSIDIKNTIEGKGVIGMAGYIAMRVVELEEGKAGAGKEHYRKCMTHPVWKRYKEDVDLILSDLGHADLIDETIQ